MRSETLVTLSQNELDAFTVIGSIDCKGLYVQNVRWL